MNFMTIYFVITVSKPPVCNTYYVVNPEHMHYYSYLFIFLDICWRKFVLLFVSNQFALQQEELCDSTTTKIEDLTEEHNVM
jgi:hypothetical protein